MVKCENKNKTKNVNEIEEQQKKKEKRKKNKIKHNCSLFIVFCNNKRVYREYTDSSTIYIDQNRRFGSHLYVK